MVSLTAQERAVLNQIRMANRPAEVVKHLGRAEALGIAKEHVLEAKKARRRRLDTNFRERR
jgi:hypothetical protein